MKTNKIMIGIGMAALLTLLIMSVAEATPLDGQANGKCTWTREGNEYRPTRTFQGVWGRFSDGNIKCFSPGNNWQEPKETTPTETCKEECHEETYEECKEKCVWIPHCNKWNGWKCKNWEWKEHCWNKCQEKTREICEEVCK